LSSDRLQGAKVAELAGVVLAEAIEEVPSLLLVGERVLLDDLAAILANDNLKHFLDSFRSYKNIIPSIQK